MNTPGSSYRPWLPDVAVCPDAVEAMLATILQSWSNDWMVRRRLRPSGRLVRDPGMGEATWFAAEDAVGIAISETGRLALVRAMCDVSDGNRPETEEDHRVIGALVNKALDDLMRRLGEFATDPGARWTEFAPDEDPSLADRWTCPIAIGAGATVLRFALSHDALVKAIKAVLPAPPPSHSLRPVSAGVLAQTVSVSARLGAAKVSLADLTDLEIGDVIVLDTSTSAPATLAIDAKARDGLLCRVDRRDTDFALTLLQPLHG